MVRNNFMMHFCIVATLCFFEKNTSRNYYSCDQDENSLGLCFKSMYLTLIVAIFTSNFIFSMFKSFHTCRNINISNHRAKDSKTFQLKHLPSVSAGIKKIVACLQDLKRQTWTACECLFYKVVVSSET